MIKSGLFWEVANRNTPTNYFLKLAYRKVVTMNFSIDLSKFESWQACCSQVISIGSNLSKEQHYS